MSCMRGIGRPKGVGTTELTMPVPNAVATSAARLKCSTLCLRLPASGSAAPAGE
jgi:hypothetical protein